MKRQCGLTEKYWLSYIVTNRILAVHLSRLVRNHMNSLCDPNQNKKDFSEYYFQNTPTAAGMATISFMESEVTNYEQKALEDIAAMVGAKDISLEKLLLKNEIF